MKTINIKISNQAEFNMELPLPAFFKDKQLDRYIGIYSETSHICVLDYISNKMICFHSHIPIMDMDNLIEITGQQFQLAMIKCQEEINRKTCILEHSHDITAITRTLVS